MNNVKFILKDDVIIKIDSTKVCEKCKCLEENDEIIILKNSKVIHKNCFMELKQMYENK